MQHQAVFLSPTKFNAVAAVGMRKVRIGGMSSQVDNVNRILDRVVDVFGIMEGKGMHKIYDYTKSREACERVVKVIPAGIACIEKIKRLNLPKVLNEKGSALKDGLIKTAKKYGYDLHVKGAPSLFYLRIADDPSPKLHQAWIAECVRRGVFFTNPHNLFMYYELSDEDIRETVEIADEAFAALAKRL